MLLIHLLAPSLAVNLLLTISRSHNAVIKQCNNNKTTTKNVSCT